VKRARAVVARDSFGAGGVRRERAGERADGGDKNNQS
jgi:hypothetical protein